MGTLQFQKGWFKPKENYDRIKSKWKNSIQAGFNFLVGIILKIYLQFLFVCGAFSGRIEWVDKQIKWCYNIFEELNIPYQKYY